MVFGDRVSDLQKRLDALPPELEDLYDRMLSSLDPFYLEHAAQLFEFVRVSVSPPSLFTLACADEDESFLLAIKGEIRPFSRDHIRLLQETMRRRVNSRCKGLLEIGSVGTRFPEHSKVSSELEEYTVQYLHRTVKDYVESPLVETRFRSAMRSPYNAHLSHCIGTLRVIKGTPTELQPPHTHILFHTQIRTFLHYAKGVNQQNEGQFRDLMEEFDVACTEIALRSTQPDMVDTGQSGNILWAYPDAYLYVWEKVDFPFNCHLLSLATRCGILPYVIASTFEQGARVPAEGIVWNPSYSCVYQPGRYPLLLDAVTLTLTTHWLPCDVPNIGMVEFLLKNGADPNEVVMSSLLESRKPFTVWRAALAIPRTEYQDWRRTNNDVWRKWLQLYKLFLDRGAGQFKGVARSRAKSNVQRMSSRAVFSNGNWETLIHELREGRELPDIYSCTPTPSDMISNRRLDELETSYNIPKLSGIKRTLFSDPEFERKLARRG